jgi:hypothetical protein
MIRDSAYQTRAVRELCAKTNRPPLTQTISHFLVRQRKHGCNSKVFS